MPFTKYENDSVEESHTIDPDNLPIFLIPGINGNGNELYALAEAINTKRGGRTPIYIYEEPIIDGEPLQFTLAEHAALIAEEIQEIRQFSPLPYILVGYSFGGILSYEVALKLQSQNYDPRLYIIDEPSKTYSQNYMKKDTDSFKTDLVRIVNYAATLSNIHPISITNQLLSKLHLLTLEERIDQLASEVMGSQAAPIQESQESSFYTFLETAKRNLRNILRSERDQENKLSNIHLIFTNETALKYSDGKQTAPQFTGGWEVPCSTKPKHLNPSLTSELSKQPHMALLKGSEKEKKPQRDLAAEMTSTLTNVINAVSGIGVSLMDAVTSKPKEQKDYSNAELVAGLITNNLKNEITEKYLMQQHMQDILRRNKKRSPIQFFNLFNTSKDMTNAVDAAPLDANKAGDNIDDDSFRNDETRQSARSSRTSLAA